MKKEVLNIEHLNMTFDVGNEKLEVIKNIDFSVKEGEFICIVGASGCGKSTFLKIISSIVKPTAGTVLLNGNAVIEPSLDCGMVFQESRLYPWLSVEKNIEFGIAKKISKEEKKKLVQEHIDLVGLRGFEKVLPNQLSGGMQQRVSIARALVNRPSLLLLDEPFGALDAFTRINMQNELLNIWEKEKSTMILVTHDIDEAIYLGTKVVVMSNRPGIIKTVVDTNLPRPRERTSDVFYDVRKKIYSEFYESVTPQIEYNI